MAKLQYNKWKSTYRVIDDDGGSKTFNDESQARSYLASADKQIADAEAKRIEAHKPVKYFDSRLGRYLAFKTEEDKASYLAHPTNKPKEPKPPKKTQAEKDAEKKKKKIKETREKNEADPVGNITDIDAEIEKLNDLKRKTKEGSTQRLRIESAKTALVAKKDSIYTANPAFKIKSLVQNLSSAVNAPSTNPTKVAPKVTAKVEPPKPAKVYKSMKDARKRIKGQEKKDVRALATKIQREKSISRDEAWTKALTISNIQFKK